MNLTDAERYIQIGKSFFRAIFTFGNWPLTLIPILIGYIIWIGPSFTPRIRGRVFRLLFLQLFSYFLVFLFSPYNLGWHLDTSLWRLLLQLWPSFLLAAFYYLKTPEEALKYMTPPLFPAGPQSR